MAIIVVDVQGKSLENVLRKAVVNPADDAVCCGSKQPCTLTSHPPDARRQLIIFFTGYRNKLIRQILGWHPILLHWHPAEALAKQRSNIWEMKPELDYQLSYLRRVFYLAPSMDHAVSVSPSFCSFLLFVNPKKTRGAGPSEKQHSSSSLLYVQPLVK